MAIRADFHGGPMDGSGRMLAVPRLAPRELRFMRGPGPDGWLLVGVDGVGMWGPHGQVVVYALDVTASELSQGVHGQDQGSAVYVHEDASTP